MWATNWVGVFQWPPPAPRCHSGEVRLERPPPSANTEQVRCAAQCYTQGGAMGASARIGERWRHLQALVCVHCGAGSRWERGPSSGSSSSDRAGTKPGCCSGVLATNPGQVAPHPEPVSLSVTWDSRKESLYPQGQASWRRCQHLGSTLQCGSRDSGDSSPSPGISLSPSYFGGLTPT